MSSPFGLTVGRLAREDRGLVNWKRILGGLVCLAVAAILLPPFYYGAFPPDAVELPPPGRRIPVSEEVSVNVLDRGEGAPVVLIHGLPGTGYNWEAVQDGLVDKGYRVLAYDRVGYGRSDPRTGEDYTPEANARELLALLDAEDLRDTTVVGWSYGGKTAMTAALLDPSRIGRLVLVGSAGQWDDPPPYSVVFEILSSAPVIEWIASVPPVFRGVQEGMGRQFFSDQTVPERFGLQSTANFDLAQTRSTWRAEAARFRFDGPDPTPITLPILLVHGDDDRVIPLVVAEGIHARAPNSELEVVEGGSHAIPATHPERLVDSIVRFAAPKAAAPR